MDPRNAGRRQSLLARFIRRWLLNDIGFLRELRSIQMDQEHAMRCRDWGKKATPCRCKRRPLFLFSSSCFQLRIAICLNLSAYQTRRKMGSLRLMSWRFLAWNTATPRMSSFPRQLLRIIHVWLLECKWAAKCNSQTFPVFFLREHDIKDYSWSLAITRLRRRHCCR